MNIQKLSKPLPVSLIEFRVQSIKESSAGVFAIIIPYKDARADMIMLDDVVGPLNWKREHTRDNKNCIVSIWDDEKKQWVSKEDTGTESNTEAEKGLASDSFKRACTNWGIGRELYDYPFIYVEMKQGEFYKQGDKTKATSKFMRNWKRESKFNDTHLVELVAKEGNEIRYTYKR